MQDTIDQFLPTAEQVTVAAPCPPWCRFADTRHADRLFLLDGWSELRDGRRFRCHTADIATVADVTIELGAEEIEGEPMPPARVIVAEMPRDANLSAEDARTLAAALLTAADKLDEITGAAA